MIAYMIVLFDFLIFSSSPPADTLMKNAHTAIKRNPKAASICSRLTMGEKIFTQNSHPRELPMVAAAFFRMSVFHTENAICITNIPTDTHMMLFLHFFVSSSSLDEKRRRITPIMRNMTAIAMKKFLIWNAIVVNAPRTQSEP
jgi:hypothetical protein